MVTWLFLDKAHRPVIKMGFQKIVSETFCQHCRKRKKLRLIYISQGNIPSKWVHTFQTMKMAQAFAKMSPSFELLTKGDLPTLFHKPEPSKIFDWYGIHHSFHVTYLPVYRRFPENHVELHDYFPRFIRVAVGYARLHRSVVVFTREPHAAYLATKWKLPTIFEFHGGSEHCRFDFIRKTMGRPHLLGIVTISEIIKDEYVEYGVPQADILVLPTAVDLHAFNNLPDKKTLCQRLQLPSDTYIATYCGHLYQNRGVEGILQAAESLPEVCFLFVGGWERDVQKYQAQASHLRNVIFTGFISNKQVPEYLGASDVLLMPYSSQCSTAKWMSPMKLFEYMAAKRPIIATDIPALHSHLVHGRNSFIIPPDNPEELTRSIRTLMRRPILSAQLAQRAYHDVQSYTWEKRARSILETFIPEMFAQKMS